jgi:hypothetical protein
VQDKARAALRAIIAIGAAIEQGVGRNQFIQHGGKELLACVGRQRQSLSSEKVLHFSGGCDPVENADLHGRQLINQIRETQRRIVEAGERFEDDWFRTFAPCCFGHLTDGGGKIADLVRPTLRRSRILAVPIRLPAIPASRQAWACLCVRSTPWPCASARTSEILASTVAS